MLLSPPITFAVFIASQHGYSSFSISRVFTALFLLQLFTQPLSSVFQQLTPLVGSLTCYRRIQSFLEKPPRSKENPLLMSEIGKESPSKQDTTIFHKQANASYMLSTIEPPWSLHRNHLVTTEILRIRNGSFGWVAEKPILNNISLTFQHASFNFIIGPVASGKTTLLQTLLGETLTLQGSVVSSVTRYAFCDQNPWLKNTTTRENICGFDDFDIEWVQTCYLCHSPRLRYRSDASWGPNYHWEQRNGIERWSETTCCKLPYS